MALRALTLLVLLAGMALPAEAAIERTPFGTTPDGQAITLYTLTGAGGMRARIMNFGAVIVSLDVPNKQGGLTDTQLGFDTLAEYRRRVYGAVIGRYVGRISHGGSFTLDGKTYQLEKSDPNAKFVIHGGKAAFSQKVWQAQPRDGGTPSLVLTMTSPDGDGGFPGAVTTRLVYTVTPDNSLRLDYDATTDRPTPLNLTHHAYWALQGEGHGDISNQTLQVFADKFLPQDEDNLVTGEIASVKGTPLDFRKPKRIGEVLNSTFPQIAMRQGLDICMIVNGKPGALRPAARLSDSATGITLTVLTTEPAVQLYGDGIGTRVDTGKGGKPYPTFSSMSLETEGYLDAVNHPNFPSTIVTPQKPFHSTTVFHFTVAR